MARLGAACHFLILIIPFDTPGECQKNVFLLIIEICLQCVVDAFHHILKIGIVRIHRTGLLRNFFSGLKIVVFYILTFCGSLDRKSVV